MTCGRSCSEEPSQVRPTPLVLLLLLVVAVGSTPHSLARHGGHGSSRLSRCCRLQAWAPAWLAETASTDHQFCLWVFVALLYTGLAGGVEALGAGEALFVTSIACVGQLCFALGLHIYLHSSRPSHANKASPFWGTEGEGLISDEILVREAEKEAAAHETKRRALEALEAKLAAARAAELQLEAPALTDVTEVTEVTEVTDVTASCSWRRPL